jgi:hypothetical protein
VDDIAALLAHGQIVFLVWVTFGEHKWVILAERRSQGKAPCLATPGFPQIVVVNNRSRSTQDEE